MVAMESVDSVANYRTIFLVDASAAFRATFCGRRFEIELPPKKSQLAHLHPHLQGHSSGGGPASFSPFIAKSLYSCAVEALFEYCRIVWDLFPNGERAIKVSACLSDYVRPLNSWEVGQQNYLALHDAFGRLSSTLRLQQAAATGGAGLQHQSSVENDLGLAYLTNGFAAELDSLSTANFDLTGAAAAATTTNSARIIIVTALPKNAAVVKALQEKIRTIVEEHGQMSQESRARIKALDVIVINTVPCQEEVSGHESPPPLRPSKNLRGCPFFTEDLPTVHLSANLSFTVYSTFSSSFLSSKLTNMAFEHFDLASSTISGIPMKEEQNAGSSANYDVEIVHSKRVHTQFFDSCVYAPIASDLSGFFSTCSREGHQYQTLILKWCTPKSSFSEMNNIMGSYRLTAVDVNSRPSSCLINFLHTGKTVNLEMTGRQTATKSSTHPKLTSHSLQSLNGELYINVLNCTRSPIEEPPSISEGVGGRVTDYRVNELAELMRAHRLVRVEPPAKTGAGHHEGLTTVAPPAVDRFRASRLALQRATLYWPLSFGFTVFFNIRDAGYANFYSLLSRDRLSGAAEVAELRNLLIGLAGSEAKGVNLPINAAILRTSAAASGSGKSAASLKREDHYRILWLEMEHILRCYCRLAENGNGGGGGGGSGGITAANPAHQEIFSLFESVKPHSGASFDASHLRLLLPPSGNGTGNGGVDRAKTPPPSLFSAQAAAAANQNKPENGEALVTEAKGVGSLAAAADQKTRPKSLFDPGHVVPSASSIHEMFVARMETKNSSRRREFIGRLTADGAKKVKLYKEMLPQPGAANANATAGDDLQQQQQQKSAVHSN